MPTAYQRLTEEDKSIIIHHIAVNNLPLNLTLEHLKKTRIKWLTLSAIKRVLKEAKIDISKRRGNPLTTKENIAKMEEVDWYLQDGHRVHGFSYEYMHSLARRAGKEVNRYKGKADNGSSWRTPHSVCHYLFLSFFGKHFNASRLFLDYAASVGISKSSARPIVHRLLKNFLDKDGELLFATQMFHPVEQDLVSYIDQAEGTVYWLELLWTFPTISRDAIHETLIHHPPYRNKHPHGSAQYDQLDVFLLEWMVYKEKISVPKALGILKIEMYSDDWLVLARHLDIASPSLIKPSTV